MKILRSLATSLFLVILLSSPLHARDFRNIIKIPVAPTGFVSDSVGTDRAKFKQIDQHLIEQSVRKIVASWNNNTLSEYLADNFQDKILLINTIRRSVPRDASLRVLSVQGVSTLEQKELKQQKDKNKQLQSIVIATVELQIEFSDPFNGFVRLPHTSQFYLQVTESE